MDGAVGEAQKAFTAVYNNSTYPLCSTVHHGLKAILERTYNGYEKEFRAKFVQPTLDLLGNLKAEGFPLIKNGQVVLHLVAPTEQLESGEMFFQVGRSTPGTLSLKFTKYKDNRSVIHQPSEVERQDYHRAFTQKYLEYLRSKALLGDQLMRILIASSPDPRDTTRWNVVKIEAKKIMPMGDPVRSVSPGIVRSPSTNEDTSHVTLPVQACHPGRPVTPEPVPVSEGERENVTQVRPVLVSQLENKEEDQPIADAAEVLLPDPDFPPIKDGSSHSAVAQPSVNHANPKYPPARIAVLSDGKENEGNKTAVSGSTTGVANPKYPPTEEAVQTDGAVGPNPKYPPITEAVKASTPDTGSGQEAASDGSNPAYPPTRQAVGFSSESPSACSGCSSTARDPTPTDLSRPKDCSQILYPPPADILYRVGSASNRVHSGIDSPPVGSNRNDKYPPVFDAVGDAQGNAVPVKSGDASNSSYPTPAVAVGVLQESNPKYPPTSEAVKSGKPGGSLREVRTDNPHMMDGSTSAHSLPFNPKYPIASDAVRDDKQGCAPDEAGISTISSCHPLSNSQYPVAKDAVRSETQASLTGAVAVNPSMPGNSTSISPPVSNLKYPLACDAVGGGAQAIATPHTTDTQGVTSTKSVSSSDPMSDTTICNPKYPPIGQAIKEAPSNSTVEGASPDVTCPQSGSSSDAGSGTGMCNPQYPPIGAAVQDDTLANPRVGGEVNPNTISVSGAANPLYIPECRTGADGLTDDTEGTLTEEGTATCGFRGVRGPTFPIREELYQTKPEEDSGEAGTTMKCPEVQKTDELSSALGCSASLSGAMRSDCHRDDFCPKSGGSFSQKCPKANILQIQPGLANSQPKPRGEPAKNAEKRPANSTKAYPDFFDDDNNSLF